jgi:hypothetical protein
MISPRVAAVSFALAAALPAFAASYDGEAPFEKATETSTVKLGPSDAAPPAEKEIRCFYFSRLMVKELDEREVGDTQISYTIDGPGPASRSRVARTSRSPASESCRSRKAISGVSRRTRCF